jgi:hypothetical protein
LVDRLSQLRGHPCLSPAFVHDILGIDRVSQVSDTPILSLPHTQRVYTNRISQLIVSFLSDILVVDRQQVQITFKQYRPIRKVNDGGIFRSLSADLNDGTTDRSYAQSDGVVIEECKVGRKDTVKTNLDVILRNVREGKSVVGGTAVPGVPHVTKRRHFGILQKKPPELTGGCV